MNHERYEGLQGLERLKQHMRVAYAERKQGTGAGWSDEYFRGLLSGLGSAGAISSEISLPAHQFVSERGYLTR